MSSRRIASGWQVRLLGGALGAIVSGMAALITSPTGIGLIVGLVGMPVGALVGMLYAPEMAEPDSTGPGIARVTGLATVLGTFAFAVLYAMSQSEGARPLEVLHFAFLTTLLFGVVGMLFGAPMALVVTLLATAIGRRLAPRAAVLWIPSAMVIAAVGAATVVAFALAANMHGDAVAQAAGLGRP